MVLTLIIIGCVGLCCMFLYWLWPKIKGTSVATALPDSVENFLNTASNMTIKGVDMTGVVSSYLSLTAIRKLDCVEADPKAIEATDYLRGVLTAWRKEEATTIVATTTPTVETLAAELATLKAELAATKTTTTKTA